MKYNFSDNIQRAILYLLKADKDFHLQISNLVKPDHFEFTVHSNLFLAVRDYFEQYHKLPSDDILMELVKKEKGSKEDLSDYEDEIHYINNLDTSSLDSRDYYLDLIEDFARKQEVKEAIRKCVELVKEDRLDETEETIRNALMVARTVDYGQDYFLSVKERWERANARKGEDKFKTALPTFNHYLEGGHNAKELCMVIAPPGVGKSLFLVNQAATTLMEGKKVLYVSLEMSEDKIANRFDSVTTLLPNRKLKETSTQLTLHERLEMFKEHFPGSDLIIKEYPTGQATVNTIRALLVQLKSYKNFIPDLVIVDYLELLRPVRSVDAEYIAQQRISEELRGLAVEYNCLVWTATQTNREGKKVKLITDAQLGDSYGKIRTADWAVSLNQTEEEYDNGRIRAYVVKARDSKQRYIVPMDVDYTTLRMMEGSITEDMENDISGISEI